MLNRSVHLIKNKEYTRMLMKHNGAKNFLKLHLNSSPCFRDQTNLSLICNSHQNEKLMSIFWNRREGTANVLFTQRYKDKICILWIVHKILQHLTLFLSVYKSNVEISQNFVGFSKYTNFNCVVYLKDAKVFNDNFFLSNARWIILIWKRL